MKFSLIIPIYNARETLAETLKSVLGQTRMFEEILCVDNNSSDDSCEVIKNIMKEHANIQYILEEKQGVAAARNRGLREATGDYIMFLDADDLMFPELLQQAEAFILKHKNAQMYQFNFLHQFENGRSVANKYILDASCYKGPIFLKTTLRQFREETKHMVWTFIFAADFLIKYQLTFDEDLEIYEDIAFLHKAYKQAETICVEKIIGVEYRFIKSSLTNDENNKIDYQNIANLIEKLSPMTEEQRAYIELLAAKTLTKQQFNKLTTSEVSFKKGYTFHKLSFLFEKIRRKFNC